VAVADLAPGLERGYVDAALDGQRAGHMLPWIVRELTSGQIIGSTRYHDIAPAIDRIEIGYTFYAQRWQRTHVNSACKRLLLEHAFDTLGCRVVGFRVDNLNQRSQAAVTALGARLDGVLRHFQARRDGSVRDAYIYSILASEWPAVRARLDARLARGPAPIIPL
jgi:RimJ/RimL family protein N-acetyltransferase